MYERERELAAVREAVDRLRAGPEGAGAALGDLLLFSGAAGLGKTTLLAEARRTAARDCTVLFARGSEQEHTVPFHVVRQLLQPVLAGRTEAECRELFGGWYEIAGPAVGLFAQGDGALPDPQGVRDGLDWVVTRLAVLQPPIVLVVDDAHWADLESLAWFAAFAVRLRELPVLAVLGYRPGELPEAADTFRTLVTGRAARPIGLNALSPDAVAGLVRSALGDRADGPFCHECWAVTGGNPYETVELIARVQDRGIEPVADAAPLLRDLAATARGSGLVRRLERLGPGTVRLAWAAAVLGTEISPGLAATVAGLGLAEAADAVDRLRTARILTGTTLEFVHPLIATAVYSAIPPATRTALHGQAAWAVADAGLGIAAAARHLLETHPDSDPDTVDHLRAAARENLRAGAPEAARRCLERALREPPRPADRAAVLYELGCSALLTAPAVTVNHLRAALAQPDLDPDLREDIAFRLAQALAHSDRLVEAAEVVGDEAGRTESPSGRLRLQTAHFLWQVFDAYETEGPARSRRLARLAEHLGGHTEGERAVLCLRAWDATLRGEPAATTLAIADRALGLASRAPLSGQTSLTGQTPLTGQTSLTTQTPQIPEAPLWTGTGPGPSPTPLGRPPRHSTGRTRSALSYTDPDWGFELPSVAALSFMYADQPDRAEEMFGAAIAECEQAGWSGAHLSFGFTLLGLVRFRQGRLGAAEGFAREGVRLADRVGRRVPAQWYAVGLLIDVLLSRGHLDEAQQVADNYDFGPPFPSAVVFPDPQTVLGRLLLSQGRHTEAAAELAEVGRRMEAKGALSPTWCPWAGHLALAVADDDPDRARLLVAQTLERARRHGTATAIGQALRTAAAVADGGPEALALLEEAVDLLSRSPSLHEYAEALVDLGAALRRADRADEAADRLYAGVDLAVRCEADGLADRARAELAATGPRLRPLRVVDSPATPRGTAER
ncbi:ATP-binding protein [Peterkaempfera bronchialis]|uniref:ATP-binding protein n=1 Tax=Peterkaempfera bronchialis TaxID=2126346 RepID=UPI003C2F1F3B